MRASGKARGVHFRAWLIIGAACQHPAYVLWYKQPLERRGRFLDVLKTPAEDRELQSLFAGRVDGATTGNVRVRICGPPPCEPHGGGAHRQPTGRTGPVTDNFCAGPGLPPQLGLAVDEYAQLGRYAKEAFRSEVNFRVHRCTKLAHSTLNRPVFDPELEGVPENWKGVRVGTPDICLPDRLLEWTTRSCCRGHNL